MLLIVVTLLAGCAGTEEPEAPDDALQEAIRRRAQMYERARNLVTNGTPASIEEGLSLLAEEDLQTTERGAELAFAALGIRRIVYPFLEPIEYPVTLPSTSLYGELFRQVEEGVYPEVQIDEASFITLLISSLTLLAGRN